MSACDDRDLLAGRDLDDRLLPALLHALVQAAALRLRLHLGDVHREDADLEELLDPLQDLRLVRVGMDAECVFALLDQAVALLGDDRGDQHLARGEAHAGTSFFSVFSLPARASRSSSAACETSSERAQTTAATSSSDGATTATRSRFLNERYTFSSSSAQMTTSGSCWPHAATKPAAVFVDASDQSAPSRTASVPAFA